MQDNEAGTWLARDGDSQVLEVDAAGHPGKEASPDDGRPAAEATDLVLAEERARADHEAAAGQYRNLMAARDADPGSVPWQDVQQAWQVQETAWSLLRRAEAETDRYQAEAEVG
jgi:hypothetical protein